jgi:monoamine oxidase
LNFLTSIDTDNQPENGPLSIYGLSDQRYRMRYGNYQLPTEISQHLKGKGISFQLKHNLTKIEVTRNKEIRLTFSNNRVYTFDHVILTIPTTTLRYVDYSQVQFSPLRKRIINELRYGTNTKLNLQFSKRFWYDLSADGIIYTDLPFLNSWEASSGQKGDTGILVLHTGKYHIESVNTIIFII